MWTSTFFSFLALGTIIDNGDILEAKECYHYFIFYV